MILAGFWLAGTACGIVLHPGDCEPNLDEWKDRPVDDVIGRWGKNASCVAISPRHVITTRHQGGGLGIVVEIGGVEHAESKETWFRSEIDPASPFPDRMYALRMSFYAEWVYGVLENPCTDPPLGDFNDDCVVDLADAFEFATCLSAGL